MKDEFRALRVFVRVVENGSFSDTAKEFSVAQATVSKQLSELEEYLKTKLLARTTRRLSMTEAGEKFYTQARLVLEQYDAAIGGIRNLKEKPSGNVRLASPVGVGRKIITPALNRFTEMYPDITIEHYVSDSITDLVKQGIDVTIRVGGGLQDSTHIARKLATMNRVTVASKEFLKKYGTPKTPEDLEKIPCILYLGVDNPGRWEFTNKEGKKKIVNVSGFYRSNGFETLRVAAYAGLGVLRAPPIAFASGLESGKLVRILREYENDAMSIYAVTPASNYIPYKTRVMIDFIHKLFKTNKDVLRYLA
jgi:DNA-binding transcriptional LysR family regulator